MHLTIYVYTSAYTTQVTKKYNDSLLHIDINTTTTTHIQEDKEKEEEAKTAIKTSTEYT